jgi:hypothetical protein
LHLEFASHRFEKSANDLELGGLHLESVPYRLVSPFPLLQFQKLQFKSRQNRLELHPNLLELPRYCFVSGRFKLELALIMFESGRN